MKKGLYWLQYCLPIGGGAYLQVAKADGRYWATKYYCNGKCDECRIGAYAKFTLSEARVERNKAKDLASQGMDPNTEKRTRKTLDGKGYIAFGDRAKN